MKWIEVIRTIRFLHFGNVFPKYTGIQWNRSSILNTAKLLAVLTICLLGHLGNSIAQITVSGSTDANGSYSTLKLAFDALNANGDQTSNNIVISITANTTETASAVLNQPSIASWATLTISPSGGARTISGNVTGYLVDLNGADNVTINGLNTGGNSLTITNTATGASGVIRFINDATGNTVTNATLQGSSSTAANGIVFFSTGESTGNDGNIISNCTITAAGSNLPVNAIYSNGSSVLTDNSNISISGNKISNFFNAGLASSGIFIEANSSAWTITGNRLFQTAARTSTAAVTHRALYILTAAGGDYAVNNNIIGYANDVSTGNSSYAGSVAYLYRAIEMTVSTSTTSNVQGNTISNILISTTSGSTTSPGIFGGISVLAGNVNIGTTSGNIIGATSGTGSIGITSTTSLGVISGIYATSTGNVIIQNNHVGAFSTSGSSTIGYTFNGIHGVGTGGNFTMSGNTVGSTITANSIAVGDGSTTSPVCTFRGIFNQATGIISIVGNTVQNCTVYGTGASVYNGIINSGGSSTVDINNNSVISGNNTGTGALTAITNSAAATVLNMNYNVVRNNIKSVAGGAFTAISNSGAVLNTININYNQLGNATGGLITYSVANSGAILGISNTAGAASCELAIKNNDIRGINYTGAASTHTHTYFTNSAATLTQDISNNTLTNLNVNTNGTITFLSNSVSMPTNGVQNVNNNSISGSFTRTSGNTGAITIFTSTASTNNTNVTVNNNNNNFSNITIFGAATISGWIQTDAGTGEPNKTTSGNTFNNWTGGTGSITVMSMSVTSVNNRCKSNTISNISSAGTITGITTGAGNDSIYLNTINPLTSNGGAAATIVSGINVTAGTVKYIGNNTISNLTGNTLTTGSVRGMLISAGTTINVAHNTIHGLTANANTSGTVSGLWVTGGSIVTLDANKIYDISSTSTSMTSTGIIQGIQVSGTTANLLVNISNNMIADIRTPNMSATNQVRGISVINTGTTSTNNVYYNTIYLNTTSSGTNFGSSGIHHTISTTATTATLDMRNNIIVNLSTPKGSGLTVAFRRSAGTSNSLANYASTSNNNLFYAGTPGSTRLIYSDGTSSAQTLAAYKAGVFTAGTIAPRDQASVTEDPPFLSTDPTNSNFLHINPSVATQIESGAANITGFTKDFDGQVRQGNPGYTGSSTTAPDIGADEGNFTLVDGTPPAISYTTISNNSCLSNQQLTAIITDATGVNTTSGTKPRIYYKRSTDTNTFNNNTSATAGWKYTEATNSSSPFTFTMNYALLSGGAGVSPGQTIQYFVVAQDIVEPTNIAINAGTFAAAPSSVNLTSAAFPIGGTINSFTLLNGLSGTVTVGTSGTFTSLTNTGGLFSEINSRGLAGNLEVQLLDATQSENGSVSLNTIIYGCASNYTLTIRPANAVNCVVTGDVAGTLINLNGADQVIFNGLNTGGSSLTIRNINTGASAAAIRFIADATNNTITNCTIEGSAVGTTSGIILFSTGTTTGNDDNTISNCTIKPAGSNLPTNSIYSAGTSVLIDNSGNNISNNKIQDYYNAAAASNGIFIASNSSAWTISGNRLYQTATRTATTSNIYRGINIVTASGNGYVVSNNIIGYANGNTIPSGITTYGGAFNNRFFGIEMTVGLAAVSRIDGNQVAGINLSNTVATAITAAPGIFTGISILAGQVEIGTTTGNIIGETNSNGSITVSSSITGNYMAGIYTTSSGSVSIQNNQIASISTGGAESIGYTFHGINAAGGGQFTVSDNYIGSATISNSISIGNPAVTTTGVCTVNGISNASTGGATISGNTVRNATSFGTAASVLTGIWNSGIAGQINITGNHIIEVSTTGTGTLTGISNTAAATTVNINSNIIRNISKSVASGAVTAISNSGGVLSAININNNQMGNTDGGLITYSAVANSGALTGISNTAGSVNAALSIQGNDIRGVSYSIAGTNTHTYIINSATTLSQNISGNTFTNLSINTTGAITFISNNIAMPSNGQQNINSNSISGTFTQQASSGALTLFTSTTATNNTGVTVNNNNNNFSNINISGAATISGWINTDAGTGSVNKTISGNTFSNWVGGTGAITVMNINITSTNNQTASNLINNISSAGSITGITTGAGNDNIFQNTIHTIISTGGTSTTVTGIAITSGTAKNIYQNTIYNLQANNITTGNVSGISISGGSAVSAYRNKIYNLSSSNSGITTGSVNGILISAATADFYSTLHNNRIADLKATAASVADPVRGISVANTGVRSGTNVFFNTIHLNASSSGTNFGTSGLYHAASATATTSKLDLRNNIIANLSTPKGTGLTVAFRRSTGGTNALNNYSASSNNNLFYAGTPGSTNLIYYDGTSSAETITAYKQGAFAAGIISPRDQVSISEVLYFLSTDGSNSDFLRIDPAVGTFIESGGANISGITVDFEGNIRAGNPGYPAQNNGFGTAPDIGSHEVDGRKPSVIVTDAQPSSTGNFSTLASAFAAINAYDQSGRNIQVTFINNTVESSTAQLNAGAWTTLKIYPTVADITVSGNLAGPLIDLNGADNVTIDGRVNQSGSTRSLTVTNSSTSPTSGTSAIRLRNSAENNTLKYCNVKGSSTGSDNGIILFSSSASGSGNDNNVTEYCNVSGNGSNRPVNVIYSSGSANAINNSNSIRNNSIFDYLNTGLSSNGIHINAYNSAWTISTNSFYETTSFVPTSGSLVYTSLLIDSPSGNNFSISGNFIGGQAASCGGSAWTVNSNTNHRYKGISINADVTTVSVLQNNTIRNWSYTTASSTPWCAIEVLSGQVNIGTTTTGNVIGAATGTGSIVINATSDAVSQGVYVAGSGTVSVSKNTIGAISVFGNDTNVSHSFNAVYKSNSNGAISISSNSIGSSTTANSLLAGSLATNASSAQHLRGIYSEATGTITCNLNTISNLTNNYSGTLNSQTRGIQTTGGTSTISRSTIHSLSSNSPGTGHEIIGIELGSTSGINSITESTIFGLSSTNANFTGNITGIYFTGNTGNNALRRNFIRNLSVHNNSSGAVIYGIFMASGVNTVANNIISLGGNTTTTIYGIYESGTSSNHAYLYFNTVYIEGSLSSGSTNKSYCLFSADDNNIRDFRNNILANFRSTTGGSSLHYAIYYNYSGANSLTVDYNVYYTPGTGGVPGYYNGSDGYVIPIVNGEDQNSQITNPQFVFPGSTLPTGFKLNIQIDGVHGTGIIIDFEQTARGIPPNVGAWEFNPNQWLGTVSTNFADPANWSANSVPVEEASIVFAISGAVNHCYLDEDRRIGNIVNPSEKNFVVNGKTLTMLGDIVNTSTGKVDATIASSKLVLAGDIQEQTIPGQAFVDSLVPRLIIENIFGVYCLGNISILDTLALNSANPSETRGVMDINTSYTLTLSPSAVTTGEGEVTGIVTRNSFSVGTEYTFNSANAKISFPESGTYPTSISVKLSIGTAPSWKSSAIQRIFEFVQTGASATTPKATITANYLDAELNGNPEDRLVFFSNAIPQTIEHGRTSINTMDNTVRLNSVNMAFFPSTFNTMEVTLGNNALETLTWNGSQSTSWTTPFNWTPTGAASEFVKVIIPDATTTSNDPELPGESAIKSIWLLSNSILNASTNASVQVVGTDSVWVNANGLFNPGTSNVIFSGAGGILSGTTGFNNISISSGASFYMADSSVMRIAGAVTNQGKWLTAALGTTLVDYNGGNQTIAIPDQETNRYSSLTLSGSGIKTFPSVTLSILGNLSVLGTASVTAQNNLLIYDSLMVGTGTTFDAGGKSISIGGNLVHHGSLLTTGSTFIFNGSDTQKIRGTASTTAFEHLNILSTSGLSAEKDLSVNGILNLVNENASQSAGLLDMGSHTLTMGATATTTGIGDVTGIIRRTTINAGTNYTMGHSGTTVNFASGGTLPSEIKVKIRIGTSPSWKTEAIQRVYEFIQTGGSGCFATITAHYIDSELNSNVEEQLVFWMWTPGPNILELGRTGIDTVNKTLILTDVAIEQWGTAFGQMEISMANSANITITWNGSVSSTWNNANNWTPSVLPSQFTRIAIPNAATTNYDPVLLSTVNVFSISIQANGIIDGTSCSQLNIRGFNSNTWENNNGTFIAGSSTVNFYGANNTISGTTNFNSLSVMSGAYLAPETGCTIRISGSLVNNGTLDATANSNTIEYNGTNQTVIIPNGSTPGYHHLTLSGSGLKAFPASLVHVFGTMSLSGTSSVTAAASLEIHGNLSLANSSAFSTGAFEHFISGNLSINGQFTANASNTLNLNGTTAQIITGDNPVIFANITINNAVAVRLNTSTEATVSGTLTINPGKRFEINSGKQLYVTGTIVNLSGAAGFVLKSDVAGTASLIHNTANVPATVERYISGAAEDWHFLSSPVSNQSISGTWIPAGTYGNGTGYDLYVWDEPTPCWVYHLNTTVAPKWDSIHPSSNFVTGRGYLYSVQAANPTKSFAGTLHNGNYNFSITQNAPPDSLKGFNLIGNPYPSSIDWRSVTGWSRNMLMPSGSGYDLWLWNPAANNYGVVNSFGSGSGTNGVTQFIAPMQGFFVRASSNGNIGFSNTTRVHSGASAWFSPPPNGMNQKIKVRVESNDGYGFDETLLHFGFPRNEAGAAKIFSPKKTAPSAYLRFKGNDLSVAYYTDIEENPQEIVYFIPGANGDYTLSVTFDQEYFEYLILEDRITKTLHDLRSSPTYKFTGKTTELRDRFILHFAPHSGHLKEKLPARIYYSEGDIIVDLTMVDEITEIKITDLLGRALIHKSLEGKGVYRLPLEDGSKIIAVYAKGRKRSLSTKIFKP